ncbi:dTDP-4-dehydrorhamnose reductase [uncultured Bacteroides sp.]|uniref:dTDP-4-dehydrorhamnose reductase n=1 Tax=uncultured Bacteroides sp. TaxID=162156 RepID=UPI00266F0FA0|nr:dTDP-4-dehydrorhamnose reductase [uncultured Bacteroides sp.]
MNILITGANGQLGNCIRNASAGLSNNYIFTDVAELDITDADAVRSMVMNNSIDMIVNCAAYTNVDKAEDDPEFAELLNAGAVRNLAEAIRDNGGTLIHISTDYVFGKDPYNVPCREDQTGTPTGVYGLTKLHGEQAIRDSGVKAIVIRTAWLYSEYGKNFVKTMLNLTSTKPELKVVFDQTGTPTYAQDLADAIIDIIEHGKYVGNEGIYHYSNEGVCSWYDFTKIIAEMAGNTACDIQPCHSCEFPSKVVRPSYSVLDKTKFKETFHLKVPYWTDSLKNCINNLQTNEA